MLLRSRFLILYCLLSPLWKVVALRLQNGTAESLSLCPELKELPVYVLNLDRRQDRLAAQTAVIEDQAPWLMEHTCRVAAPDGSAITTPNRRLVNESAWDAAMERKRNHRKTGGNILTPGSIALILGHGLVWEQIRQQNFSFGILMEDDISHFHPGLEEFLCDLAKRPLDWEYLQIQRKNHRNDSQPLSMIQTTDFNTGMYAITREAAARALEYHFPIRRRQHQIDSRHEFLRSRTKAFMTEPAGALQSGSRRDTDTQIYMHRENQTRMRKCRTLRAKTMMVPALLHPGE
mmetsp:Transcript_89975/g.263001  ORF Transcript_89975/g.263001 Transcript_89975/m.263001 type:complete len:290 (-) Transcript_89975:83-952(-)